MNCELQKLALEYNAEEDAFGTDHDLKPVAKGGYSYVSGFCSL